MTRMRRWDGVRGVIAGGMATVIMTVALEAMFRRLPHDQQAPMPPRQITVHAAEAVGLARHLDEPARFTASLVMHAAYGTGTGAVVYALLRRFPASGIIGGILAGIIVYLLGYAGWLPLLGLYPPIPEETAARSGQTLAAHIVWGAVLGWYTQADTRLSSFRADTR
jgi:uncharacterized membrane protein YagU involved in acid resistance